MKKFKLSPIQEKFLREISEGKKRVWVNTPRRGHAVYKPYLEVVNRMVNKDRNKSD